MKKLLLIVLIASIFSSCKKNYEAPVPDSSGWNLFDSSASKILSHTTQAAMEGIYALTQGNGIFGSLVAIKWSYVVDKRDTTYHVSGFFGKDIAYFICEGKRLGGSILFNGYWRKMVSAETGIMRLTISATNGATDLLSANPTVTKGSVTITGFFGYSAAIIQTPISFTFERPLNKANNFMILAHRSGGRTSDLLPVSENSVAMIKKTAEFGSTGIEIDIRITKDGVPILYHDNTLNIREVQKSGLVGPIENYTYDQLSTFVRLIHGEKIPTLREALNTVIFQTPLTFVWLDTKYVGPINRVQAIQNEYLQLAANAGRKLDIVIGLPTEDTYNQFVALPNHLAVPSLLELKFENVPVINAKVWAPRFTLGMQDDLVEQIHAQGRLAFVWTLDVPEYIERFINNGHFDGILSNYPSCVAYYHYAHQ